GLPGGAAENQQRNKGGGGSERNKTGVFKAAPAFIVKHQRAGSTIKPENAEEESDVTDARGDECFFCGGGRAWPIDPESNEQVRCEREQLPGDKEKEQAVSDNKAEHSGGENRQREKKPGEILVVC